MIYWLTFAGSAALIIFAGRKLSQYGDEIAEQTGLGRAFIGSLLLAGATSLPEVVASVSAAWGGAGNLAMGNVFGSNIFNMAILVPAQWAAAKPMLANASRSHITVAAAGMLLSGIAAAAMVIKAPILVLGGGIDAWLIGLSYILLLRLLPRQEEQPESVPGAAMAGAAAPSRGSAGLLWGKFAAMAAVIIVAGYFLSQSSDQIAAATGLGQTFVGSTLLAAATSLPEVTVTVDSARRGAYDLALGNVMGSNIFNMLILILADLAMPGPAAILSTATNGQIVSAMFGLILSALAVLGLSTPDRASKRPFQWDTAAIGLTYVAGTWILYVLR